MTATPEPLSAAEAVERCNLVLAHAWMIRTFLKHADDVQEVPEMLEVPRLLFDTIRAVEPARERGDYAEYLRRLRGKLSKIRKVSEMFSREFRNYSVHTNFEMAALSLQGVVKHLEAIFAHPIEYPPAPTDPPPTDTAPTDAASESQDS
ncbi:hypothetical protein [Tuwongella immobilis]|uniref:Uncharacterized protein n=1 Tax=Tuwongella immobilis TaxID=692036 RepID=A0A6C2YGK2_9BACT|nr:hypothetical protein [Tuwongella immobilis]VIP00650.1 Uncharacterized protein OS=Planctomyces maris DSM 8797 GN=PM8797T_11971 PE=4 SV=1 [Tuwongella immobilis]VTR96718.1 Uncharacterized protein OS=Planctomyces maris DSM 8797 GN=PM8797T_11971 PE=4 SV=1 [Tuwongella immobilis]